MKNKKMTNNVKADPIVQLLFAKTSIQFLSKNIAEFSKTQPESKRKGIESDVECLWYALEILNSFIQGKKITLSALSPTFYILILTKELDE